MLHLLARPHILAWPFLIVWMAAVIRARDAGRVPSFALIPLMIVWSNLHAGFIAGLGMAGLLAVEAVFEAAPPNACGSSGDGEFFSRWRRRAR